MHYSNFEEAKQKWDERRMRLGDDINNYGIMLTNWAGDFAILERFENLPFPHKVAFTYLPVPSSLSLKNVFYIRGYKKYHKSRNLFNTQDITGRRFIDQFDYVKFINELTK